MRVERTGREGGRGDGESEKLGDETWTSVERPRRGAAAERRGGGRKGGTKRPVCVSGFGAAQHSARGVPEYTIALCIVLTPKSLPRRRSSSTHYGDGPRLHSRVTAHGARRGAEMAARLMGTGGDSRYTDSVSETHVTEPSIACRSAGGRRACASRASVPDRLTAQSPHYPHERVGCGAVRAAAASRAPALANGTGSSHTAHADPPRAIQYALSMSEALVAP